MGKKLHIIRTFQPHWGKHSGINQFIRYLDRYKYEVEENIVDRRGFLKLPGVRRLQPVLQKCVNWRSSQVYDLPDLVAELKAFFRYHARSYDVLHYLDGEHSLQYLPYLFKLMSSLKKPPMITAMFHQPPHILSEIVDQRTIKLLDHLMVLSPDQVEYFSQFVDRKKISMILHGVDVDYFKPCEKNKGAVKLRCLSVGSWLRDYETVLSVAERLSDRGDIEFIIVSSKVRPRPDLRNVKVYCGISDYELLRFYQNADLLFLPLIDATANNVLLEGIACGLPVLTTDLPGTRAYLTEDEAFFIVKGEVGAALDIIINLSRSLEKRIAMSKNARSRALEFSWHNFASRFQNIMIQDI